MDNFTALLKTRRLLLVASVCLYVDASLAEPRAAEPPPITNHIDIYLDGGQSEPSVSAEKTDPASRPQQKTRVFCVRTCDGFYFPLELSQDADNPSNAGSACQSNCPGAEVLPFFADGDSDTIEQAKSFDLQNYGALKHAYSYRSTLTAACACHRSANLNDSVLTDPTLRKGDIIMTSQGLVVFRGFENTNQPEKNFSPVRSQAVPAQFAAEIRDIDRQYPDTSGPSSQVRIIRDVNKLQDGGIHFISRPAVRSDAR